MLLEALAFFAPVVFTPPLLYITPTRKLSVIFFEPLPVSAAKFTTALYWPCVLSYSVRALALGVALLTVGGLETTAYRAFVSEMWDCLN